MTDDELLGIAIRAFPEANDRAKRCMHALLEARQEDNESAKDFGAKLMLEQMQRSVVDGGKFSDERANAFVDALRERQEDRAEIERLQSLEEEHAIQSSCVALWKQRAEDAEAEDLIRIQYKVNEAMTVELQQAEARIAKLVETLERYSALSNGCDYGGGETCAGTPQFSPCCYHEGLAALAAAKASEEEK